MKLYFENAVTTVTTLMILALLGYISWSAAHRAAIQHWGCRSLFLLAFGLAVCCCAAARDGLDKTIQQAIDGSCAPGLFQLVSVPTIVGCIGALVIVIAAIATPIRGLLFKAIARDHIKSAVIISSVTFGIGHIIKLFNGSGMNLVNNLCQIVFAVAVGFLLVMFFYRGGGLIPCILVHSAINTLGTFANDAELTMQTQLLHLAALILLTVGYTLILTRTLPRNTEQV